MYSLLRIASRIGVGAAIVVMILTLPAHAVDDFVWARSVGGSADDTGVDVAVDAEGNAYIAGTFSGTADFDPGPGGYNLASAGGKDGFIVKLDRNGDFVWARSFGGNSAAVTSYAVTLDAVGGVYVAGYYGGTVDFDPGFGSASRTSANLEDLFVLKVDVDGDFSWVVTSSGGALFDSVFDAAADPAGNVYVAGAFEGTVDLDPGPATLNLTSAGSTDAFILALDGSGSLLWARQLSGPQRNFCSGIALDLSGNVYCTGEFYSTVDYDPGAGIFNLTSNGLNDIFVLKLDSAGIFAWAKNMGGPFDDNGFAIAVDGGGNVYATGGFQGTVDFDPSFLTFDLTSNGSRDIFVLRMDSAGNLFWAVSMGALSTDFGLGIAADSERNVYTTGYFQSNTDFDPGPGVFNLVSGGGQDTFIQKLNATGDFIWARSFSSVDEDGRGRSVFVDSHDNVFVGGVFGDTADFDVGSDTWQLTSQGGTDAYVVKLGTVSDLSIMKSSQPNPVVAGAIEYYQIDVDNAGPSDTTAVIYDVLPEQVQFLVDDGQPNCTQPANLLGLRASLAGANEVPPAMPPSTSTGTATFVLDTTTNELMYTIEVLDVTDQIVSAHIHTGSAGVSGPIAVLLYHGTTEITAIRPFVGKVLLIPTDAAAILADPAGFYVNVHTVGYPSGLMRGQLGVTQNTPIRCEVSEIPAGDFDSLVLTTLVAPNTPALSVLTNLAFVVGANEEQPGALWDNVASAGSAVQAAADLRVTQVSAKSTNVQAGDVFTYSVFVDNLGPSFAPGVALDVVLQSTGAFDLIDVSSDRDMNITETPGGGPLAVAGSPLPPGAPPAPFGVNPPTGVANVYQRLDLSCNLTGGDDALVPDALGVLESGVPAAAGRWSLILRARAREAQTINSVVTVLSDVPDLNSGNNDAVDIVSVQNTADLAITKTATPGSVNPGDEITYSMSVNNLGPSAAYQVEIRDALPAEVEVLNVTGVLPGGGAAGSIPGTPGNPLAPATCFVGTLGIGQTGSMTIVARARGDIALDPLTGDRVIHNGARVWSATFDPVNSNNVASASTTIACADPDSPTNLAATDGSQFHSVILTWDSVPGAAGYTVYRSAIDNFATAQRLATVVEPPYVDLEPYETPSFLNCNHGKKTFTYWVSTVNSCGESLPSEPDMGHENPAKLASLVPQLSQAGDIAILLALLTLTTWRYFRKKEQNQ